MRSFCQRPPRVFLSTTWLLALLITFALAGPGYICAQGKPASTSADAQAVKAVGTIKSIQADSITVAAESGGDGDTIAKLTGSTKILRVPPGEKDLKNATALRPQDLQTGDRVLVRGQAATEGNGDGRTIVINALSVIVMKQADVAAKQQHDRDDWQKRGVGGLVTNVDTAAGTVTISTSSVGANRSIAVHITKDTILRRYASGSVKFDDAKPAPVDRIKAGDQLRARGARNPDGSEVSAEEIVSGAFRNIAGTIKAIDPANNTITVQDAITKNAVVVKVSPDSEMKKLPPEMAQRIAIRLKGTSGGGNGNQPGADGQSNGQSMKDQSMKDQVGAPAAGKARTSKPAESQAASGTGGGQGGNGPPDLQRMLSRSPNSTLADLQKGDAVMIVSTEGTDSGSVTAITLLAGVDAILSASPNQSASTLLSPWSLNASAGEGEAAQQ
jgi:hypothetical protein